jgi:integrase/recombinase XerD
LDDRYIREMVKRLALRAGVKKNVFPHSLRHTFAADLYRKTRNICIVQEALGHADLSTTMIYAYLIEEDLEDSAKIFSFGKGGMNRRQRQL